MIGKQTTLDLNGPILSFIQQPQSVSISCENVLLGSAAIFVGIATATFPQQSPENPATNTGAIAYRWYDDSGPLFDDPPASDGLPLFASDGVTISGAATTTLTLYSNTQSKKIFLRAEYVPSAYSQPLGSAVDVGTAKSTGNAINEPIDSNIVDLNLKPAITLTSQPLDQTAVVNTNAVFSTSAVSTDGSPLSYQWQINNSNLNDATEQTTSITPASTTLTITDDVGGQTTTVNFISLSTYSNFITGRTYTIVANNNIQTTITALGAGGGTSAYRNVHGGVGGFSQGTFTFLAGQTYKLVVGGEGGGLDVEFKGGYGGGGNGGEFYPGWSGAGGGGYTGLFLSTVSQSNSIIIAAGGGGGSDDPAGGGAGGGLTGGNSGNAGNRGGFGANQNNGGSGAGAGGSAGTALRGGDGSQGGSGGGGGYFGGGGGSSVGPGGAGGGSGYIHPTLLTNASTTAGSGSSGDGSFKIDLISAATKTVVVTATGTRTPNLTIRTDTVGLNQVKCIITHPTACNSPVITRTANFTVVLAGEILNYESVSDGGSFLGSGSLNLSNNPITFNGDPSTQYPSVVIYPPEKDIRVRITLAGAAGATAADRPPPWSLQGGRGGEGGLSVFEYTLKQNTEYTLKLGSVTGSIIGGANGGGGAAYLYEKARLIAVCGGGGGGGSVYHLTRGYAGGAGGGIGVGGENGKGRDGGKGGKVVTAGSLPTESGTRPSGRFGGQVSGCTIGKYYAQAGFSPCQDVGNTQWRDADGNVTSQTATIQRGYKAGQGLRNTGGSVSQSSFVSSDGGGGGSGAYGGNAADSDTSGGGGGSGYTDGSVTVISTQLGGNSSTNAFVTIGLAQTYNDFFIDSFGRILILSSSTVGKDPRTLTKTTGKVLVNTDTCIDDARWQNFIELARTQNYRLTATLNNSTTKITNATDNNIRRMINGNNITLKNSLTAWEDTGYYYQLLALAWDETNVSGGRGFGSDYSILSWSPSNQYGFGYYGDSSNPFFVGTTYSRFTANWWILPPGVPDF